MGDPAVERICREIEAIEPVDGREQRSISAALRALRGLPHPFDENADRTHATASSIVVGHRGVLLHRHKRLGIWLQPGGHIEAGELPHDAAVREVAEETGLRVRHLGAPVVAHVDVHTAAQGHVHLDLRYLLGGDDRDPMPPPGESPEVAWFGWDQALTTADAGLVGGLRRARARCGILLRRPAVDDSQADTRRVDDDDLL